MYDVIIIGAGPAGLNAAQQAGKLGARTALISTGYVGGMAATDGPVPVRTLAHAARLVREAQQLERYGISSTSPKVDYSKLLDRVREVVVEVYDKVSHVDELEALDVAVYENVGAVRFIDPHTVAAEDVELRGEKIIICAGGHSRPLPIPGFDLTVTHSDAWSLADVPESMIVVGSGATGAQVASIFNSFGTKVSMFEIAPRILMTEDEDVSRVVKEAFLGHGMEITEGFDGIDAFKKTDNGIRMTYRLNGEVLACEASLAVMAVGWMANAEELNLQAAGVELDRRGFIQVNEYMQTNVPHIFAAGNINGTMMLVSTGSNEGYYAAINAIEGPKYPLHYDLIPMGSFTDPEYAQIGLTEAKAREQYDVAVSTVQFEDYPRSIIDGRPQGFCKMIADKESHSILGCHVVGERAVETVQLVAAGMKAGLTVEQLAELPLSFPTYVAIVSWAAYEIVEQLGLDTGVPRWLRHPKGKGFAPGHR
jgi:pyruvate/2-oxoglutarate dehydrogenase complex dihydrolipoamide dehydrogenase (E3) component